ncbi:tetratricopeptide repeat protein [Synechococcus sp. L2F]|jgi:tetratricopeptide (TPR) repeat protein|uniref:tetratricopeptide repeat protein n=1 Tax=Synechococcus sp. L2F TaxID=2823739 RepID=UPI0020CE89F1|nr:tetratricopeptide repeat protein [Synechococcus sp. L2F]MCP9827910.1 tetratricopeptide repeat protein [Synechococcus sp. L2F]
MGLRTALIRMLGGEKSSAGPSGSFSLDQPPAPPPHAPASAGPASPELQFRYAEELNDQGRPDLAVSHYRQAYVMLRVLAGPAAAQLAGYTQLALPDRTSGQPMPGLPQRPGQPPAPATPNPLAALRQKLSSANAAEVEQEVRQLIVAGGRGADSFSLLGMCHLLKNQPAEAERAFREALKYDGNHFRSLVNLGGVLLKTGRIEEAVPLLESSLQHTRPGSPESLAALTNLAVAQTQLGRPIDAAQLVLRIFRIKPDHLQPDKLVVAAKHLEEMGDDTAAIDLLQHLRTRLREPDLNRRLAELLERRGDYQQAALVYRELAAGTGSP